METIAVEKSAVRRLSTVVASRLATIGKNVCLRRVHPLVATAERR